MQRGNKQRSDRHPPGHRKRPRRPAAEPQSRTADFPTAPAQQLVSAVASDGSLLHAVSFEGGLAFVSGASVPPPDDQLVALGGSDVIVQKRSPMGEVRWSLFAGGAGPQIATALAVDEAGDVWVAGLFAEVLELGALTLRAPRPAPGRLTAFVAKLHGADGTALWAKPLVEGLLLNATLGLALDATPRDEAIGIVSLGYDERTRWLAGAPPAGAPRAGTALVRVTAGGGVLPADSLTAVVPPLFACHSTCEEGDPMSGQACAGVGACVSQVCRLDPFCCQGAWDQLCVDQTAQFDECENCEACVAARDFGPTCGGMTLCDAHGTPIDQTAVGAACDTAAAICNIDSFCCTTAWDGLCVDELDMEFPGLCP